MRQAGVGKVRAEEKKERAGARAPPLLAFTLATRCVFFPPAHARRPRDPPPAPPTQGSASPSGLACRRPGSGMAGGGGGRPRRAEFGQLQSIVCSCFFFGRPFASAAACRPGPRRPSAAPPAPRPGHWPSYAPGKGWPRAAALRPAPLIPGRLCGLARFPLFEKKKTHRPRLHCLPSQTPPSPLPSLTNTQPITMPSITTSTIGAWAMGGGDGRVGRGRPSPAQANGPARPRATALTNAHPLSQSTLSLPQASPASAPSGR